MSSFLSRFARAAAALAGAVALAVVVWFALQSVLVFAVEGAVAATAASAAAAALVLVISDVYLPIGGGPRTDVLRNRPPVENAVDAALAGGVALAAALALGVAGYTDWLGIGGGLAVGYLSFVIRHREEYAAR
ncbi:hypothetical protein [Salarchaeum japonicum]|uniref:Uncharacterized protein n=1 Tax=Salarchaeum japonicum TaxID=555573 RepID=A0AAV3SZ22_9EURY|nr:hypothetical protein [Salarchaeum japonicum]